MSKSIEDSHKKGKIPADYSIGFANGLIFVEHQLSGRDGGPTFFDRISSIGTLPMPIALRTPKEVEDEFNSLAEHSRQKQVAWARENVLTEVQTLVDHLDLMDKEKNPRKETVEGFSMSLSVIRRRMDDLNQVIKTTEEQRNAYQAGRESDQEAAQGEQIRVDDAQASSERPQAD